MENLLEINDIVLDEVYIGKTKGLQVIEDELDSFRSRYMNNHFNTHINNDPQLIKINRMFEDEFGFDVFSLHIINLQEVNLFTLPVDYRVDVITQTPVVSKSGFKFNKSAKYAIIVCVYSGAIFNPHFTTGEIMASILHEIGHNFFASLNRNNAVLADTYKSVNLTLMLINLLYGNFGALVNAPLSFNSFDNAVLKMMDDARKNKKLLALTTDMFQFVKSITSTGIGMFFKIINVLSFNVFNSVLRVVGAAKSAINPMTYLQLCVGYRNERAADNFPTMYGYGSELSSFLRKVEESGNKPSEFVNNLSTIPVISAMFNCVGLIPTIIGTALDPHPAGISRTQDQLNLLKRELSTASIDPKMEKLIKADIAAIEKEMKALTDVSREFDDPDIARHIYYRYLYTHNDSKEIKDRLLDDKNKFYEYDKVFYDNLR